MLYLQIYLEQVITGKINKFNTIFFNSFWNKFKFPITFFYCLLYFNYLNLMGVFPSSFFEGCVLFVMVFYDIIFWGIFQDSHTPPPGIGYQYTHQ